MLYRAVFNCSQRIGKRHFIPTIQITRAFSNFKVTSTLVLEDLLGSSIAKKIDGMKQRHDEIMNDLTNSNSNPDTRELSSLSPLAKLYTNFSVAIEEMNAIKELKQNAHELKDDEMIEECEEEIIQLEQKLDSLSKNMMDAILPRNEDDSSDAVLEVRAGTGGEEACLFCAELLSAYEKTATAMGWKFETLSQTKTDLGGVKEAAVAISGSSFGGYDGSQQNLGPYGFLKFESGVHRVQRVPVNDVRIHTSAASVGVLPAPSENGKEDDLLPLSELNIETMRASGAGGQHVNTTESAVRVTHIPTGISASIQDERSQHKNKAKALKLITARVRDYLRAEEAKRLGETRNSLMGGGDRSERIRTYNYPQDRITDHRTKHSEHGIQKLLLGGAEDSGLVGIFAPPLREMEKKELLLKLKEER
jgi:peptide chain release factor 1